MLVRTSIAITSILVIMLSPSRASGQTPNGATNTGLAVGMSVQRLQDDFGVSGFFTSPAFLNGNARFSVAGVVAWYPYGRAPSGDQEWIPYGQTRIVVESGHRVAQGPLRLYGFGGVAIAFLPQRLADNLLSVGGVGGFGFEFFMPTESVSAPVSYFIEVAGVGSGARATNLPGRPVVFNGFLIQSGVRFYP